MRIHFIYYEFQGVIIQLRPLRFPSITIKGKLIELLRSMREIRHENVNDFFGCYLDADSLSFVFEFCSRGSLKVSDVACSNCRK